MTRFILVNGKYFEVISEKELADDKHWHELRVKRLSMLYQDRGPDDPDAQRIWYRCCAKVSRITNELAGVKKGKIQVIKES